MVSISCTTYNHEDYIADALESFLMQKTKFKYEILIHDDASTDRTAEIIKIYERKYPEIIKPIYQTYNQYSKGVKIGKFNRGRAKGKYIAICEGDDFWTDANKLQKQVDYMELHPDCSMCVHATYRVNVQKVKYKKHVRPNIGNKVYSVEEVIDGGGGLFATNSIMYPRDLGIDMPRFYNNAPIGDYPLAIYLALKGKVYYIDEFMSAYRIMSKGSWSERMEEASIDKRIDHIKKRENMLIEVDEYSNYKYTAVVKKQIQKSRFNLMLKLGEFSEIKTGQFKEYYSSLDLKSKVKIFVKQHFPYTVKLLRLLRGYNNE